MQTERVEMLDVREAPLCREFERWLREHADDQHGPPPTPTPTPTPTGPGDDDQKKPREE